MIPPLAPVKRSKSAAADESGLTAAITQLDKIAHDVAEEKPYEQFGRFIAAELRQLPQQAAIMLQQEIQNSIITAKLSCLENANPPEIIAYSPHSESSVTSVSASSNDDDVLRQALLNTFTFSPV